MTEQTALALDVPAGGSPAPAPKPASKAEAPKRFVLPDDAPAVVSKPDKKIADPAPAAEPEAKPAEATSEQTEKPDPDPEVERRREKNRLERAYRKRAEAMARAELLEKELAAERAKIPVRVAVDDAAPRLEQFDYDPEKYAAAKAEYATKKAEKDFAEKAKTAEATKLREKLVTSWEEKAEKASDKYEDFETVVGKLTPDNPFTQAIMEAEPDLAYYLAKHPKEVERLAELPTVSARIRELGKLEAKLAAEPEKPKKPSAAPAPIKPLSGAGSTKSDVPSEDDSTADWIRKRQKQVHRQR